MNENLKQKALFIEGDFNSSEPSTALDKGRPIDKPWVNYLALSLIGLGFMGLSLLTIQDYWVNFHIKIKETKWAVGVVASVMLLGVAFFILRETKKLWYSILEAMAAGITAYVACSKVKSPEDSLPTHLALLGSIYIVVRACDNFQKWVKEKNERKKKETQTATKSSTVDSKPPPG